MQFQKSVQNVFAQLDHVLVQLSDEEYCMPSQQLFKASIGQHVRHIIEFFICLNRGYHKGIISYEKRERDPLLETDKNIARKLLSDLNSSVIHSNKNLLLETSFNENSEDVVITGTNYFREILYNLEHMVHHMALIRIGIKEVSEIDVPLDFGVAASTIKYKKACAR